jgi:hypothetical protein
MKLRADVRSFRERGDFTRCYCSFSGKHAIEFRITKTIGNRRGKRSKKSNREAKKLKKTEAEKLKA